MNEEKNLLLSQEQNSVVAEKDPAAYFKPTSNRRWELAYGFKNKFYLTNEERDVFLANIQAGAKIVQIGTMTLSGKFTYLIPVKKGVDLETLVKIEKARARSEQGD